MALEDCYVLQHMRLSCFSAYFFFVILLNHTKAAKINQNLSNVSRAWWRGRGGGCSDVKCEVGGGADLEEEYRIC